MNKKTLVCALAAFMGLAACSTKWTIDYDQPIDPGVSNGWHVHGVNVTVPDELTVSNDNILAPNADIVWHGEPLGDRRAQVAAVVRDGISGGLTGLRGPRGVRVEVVLRHFHAVTPTAISRAPGAVHNISYVVQVFDDRTNQPLTEPEVISADLNANVGYAAIVAAIEGQTQRIRIVEHLSRVTRGWLGNGPDLRGSFRGVGR